MRQAGTGCQNDYSGQRNRHSAGFAPSGLFEAKEHGKYQRIDRAQPHDNGRVGDVGVMQAGGEANLVHGEAEKTEVGEGPVIAPGKRWMRGTGFFLEYRQAAKKRHEQNHESGPGNDAQRAEDERRDVTQRDFSNDEIDGPDHHQRADGEGDDSSAWGEPAVVVYAHGDGGKLGRIRGKGGKIIGVIISGEKRKEEERFDTEITEFSWTDVTSSRGGTCSIRVLGSTTD